MTVSSSTAMFGLSLLAIPMTYAVNSAHVFHGELGLFMAGVAALCSMCLLTYFLVGKKGASPDPLFYGKHPLFYVKHPSMRSDMSYDIIYYLFTMS